LVSPLAIKYRGTTMITTMDQMPPTVTVTSLAATPAGGIVQVDSTITISVTFSGDVIVTGGTRRSGSMTAALPSFLAARAQTR